MDKGVLNRLGQRLTGSHEIKAAHEFVNAAFTASYEYDPFGKVIRATGPLAKTNLFRFSTKYQDDESDLVYYGYRYYNPSTGRWISRDPIEESGGINLYAIVNNSPNNSYDVIGLWATDQHYDIIDR